MSSTCNRGAGEEVNPGFYKDDFDITYSLNKPDVIFDLSRELTEISGLTYSTKLDILYTINDEDGYVYGVSPKSGEIIDKIEFAKSDDYEGIAYNDNYIFVAESNGNIKVINESKSKREVEYDDKLSRDNDIEGLVYNARDNNILMAAKGDSEEDGNDKDFKSLFSMDISDGDIEEKPFLKMDAMDAIKSLKKRHITSNALVNLSVTSRVKEFAPSGVAIHPTNNDVYVLSAKGRLLLICDLNGENKALIFLNQSMHVQPEGICFSPDGTLYISNEGRGRSGKIYKYNIKKLK